MSANSSLPHPNYFSTLAAAMYCLTSRPSSFIVVSFNITYSLLLLPLCSLILLHCLQQWRKKRFSSSAVAMNHSDIFTFHMVTMELIRVFTSGLSSYGVFKEDVSIIKIGRHVFSFTWFGETFFHNLTCVERYLAVVHPVTYVNLRNERGIRIRNISIASAWVLSFMGMCLDMMEHTLMLTSCSLILSLIIVSFCSLSVLCVLIRPGPGERGGDRERVEQSKLRAFYTITAILGMLMGRCICRWVWIISIHFLSKGTVMCVILICQIFFDLSSSLVLPVLFLHRTGRLACCK